MFHRGFPSRSGLVWLSCGLDGENFLKLKGNILPVFRSRLWSTTIEIYFYSFSSILKSFSGNSFHILLFLDNSLELTEELERIEKNCKKKWKESKRIETNCKKNGKKWKELKTMKRIVRKNGKNWKELKRIVRKMERIEKNWNAL